MRLQAPINLAYQCHPYMPKGWSKLLNRGPLRALTTDVTASSDFFLSQAHAGCGQFSTMDKAEDERSSRLLVPTYIKVCICPSVNHFLVHPHPSSAASKTNHRLGHYPPAFPSCTLPYAPTNLSPDLACSLRLDNSTRDSRPRLHHFLLLVHPRARY